MNKYTVRMIFPTIIHDYNYDKINEKEAIEFCYEQKKLFCEGQVISNRGGWHSDFFNINDDNIISHTLTEGLSESIFTALNPSLELSITYWIMINCPNSYNTSHTHPDAHFSGVLWLKVPENSGTIKFDSPFNHTGYSEISSYLPEVKDQTGFFHGMTYDPKVGRMLTFPSALRHEVNVNKSNEDRIAISYNIHVLNHI
tara:strand:+ start:1702 stop:2298 length:597 start_codon:yes stop_codon:yes gene_type:complete